MYFWPLFVLMLVIFIAMLFALRLVIGRHYLSASAHLQSLSAEYTRRHEELKQRLEQSEQQYAEQIARAKAEAERMIAQARQEVESSRSVALEEARTESERIVQQGLESREALRKELEQGLEARAIERACELVQLALRDVLRRDIQFRWVEELLQDGLSQLDRLKSDEPAREAKVVSAFPLATDQRDALRERLRGKFGRELVVTEETDERLVAGLMITIGSRVLDGTLASKIKQAVRHASSPS